MLLHLGKEEYDQMGVLFVLPDCCSAFSDPLSFIFESERLSLRFRNDVRAGRDVKTGMFR